MDSRFHIWVDQGGTFTDLVARCPDGRIVTHKLLSVAPEGRDAVLDGCRAIMGLGPDAPFPADSIAQVKMGTTLGTNALLERRGEPTGLVITEGLGDALRIGTQARPQLFDLKIRRPAPLYSRVLEVAGRLSAGGQELTPLDLEGAAQGLEALRSEGISSLAIVLMHGYRHPDHEQALEALARELGFVHVAASHRVSPLLKLVPRGHTTVVDAYLTPLLSRRVERLSDGLAGSGARLSFMQSSGGLVDARLFRGKESILSGPVGGVVGAAEVARRAGLERVITFDMGGTSTDVAHHGGELERRQETEIAGVLLATPMLHIHTVAAGGGSVLSYDGGRLLVGPRSAGADPGPACYGRGGPPSLTDANLLLGRIQPGFFPSLFGEDRDAPLDAEAARRGLKRLAGEAAMGGMAQAPRALAEGYFRVAVEAMAAAIKRVSLERGHDPRDHALVCFGGAGGQHACAVAGLLGMERVLIHPLAGVLSALGMGLASRGVVRQRAVELPLEESWPEVAGWLSALDRAAADELAAQGATARLMRQARLRIKVAGTEAAFTVEAPRTGEEAAAAFAEAHLRRFGFGVEGKALTLEAVEVEVWQPPEETHREAPVPTAQEPDPADQVSLFVHGEEVRAPLFRREDLCPGWSRSGPLIVVDETATTVVDPGWGAKVDDLGNLLLERSRSRSRSRSRTTDHGSRPDPMLLEVFGRRFASIAEEMGEVLRSTARSVNVRERLDFSCAVFDGQGQLVANAPHIPVHLGSMGESVEQLLRRRGAPLEEGESVLLNSPYHGGTHLPDITVITPVRVEVEREAAPLFYVASRAHHADVGGSTPGSMPAHSRVIEEEGVWTEDLTLVRKGNLQEEAARAWLTAGPHPARNPGRNLADLGAQLAANHRGVRALRSLCQEQGVDLVRSYMGHVRRGAEQAVRALLPTLPGGGSATCRLDDGAEVSVSVNVSVDDGPCPSAVIDFSGTSPAHPGNFNAPLAVVKAALLYVFRSLVPRDIPLNAGCLAPLQLKVPPGCMLDPQAPAAVVAGNVETSQLLVDALLLALGAQAGSQGTMNNLSFGDSGGRGNWQYYETICGGAGAGPGFDGASAVHTHMTNSRITDPEVLELRFPVRVDSFRVRRGSGGAGLHRGGDGVVRMLRFLEPVSVSILSGRREEQPPGLAGGEPGQRGRNRVVRAGGAEELLPGCATVELQPGDLLIIETPGGGGYGKVVS